MSEKKTPEEVLARYAAEQEASSGVNSVSVGESPAHKVQKNFAETAAEIAKNRPTLKEEQEDVRNQIRSEQEARSQGYLNIPIEDLPTGGIFYPEGTKIHVRAASGQDIRHWSMINETDLSAVDEALNYIIQRCVTISYPKEYGLASYQDLKEIDRFYLILAVRDFTFIDGHNELRVVISETESVVVKKDMVKFIDIPESLLKYYNVDKRCFTIPTNTPTKEINFFMPAIGVTKWLKEYIQRKSQTQEQFDQDFVTIAPMLIRDHRGLNEKTYTELITSTLKFGIREWSIINKVKSLLEKAIEPKVIYTDESGMEKEAPLNFLGGLKAIFTYVLDDLGL